MGQRIIQKLLHDVLGTRLTLLAVPRPRPVVLVHLEFVTKLPQPLLVDLLPHRLADVLRESSSNLQFLRGHALLDGNHVLYRQADAVPLLPILAADEDPVTVISQYLGTGVAVLKVQEQSDLLTHRQRQRLNPRSALR